MNALEEIEHATQAYANARSNLAELVAALNVELEQAKRDKLPAIKCAVSRTTKKYDALLMLLHDNAALFKKPKTRVLHGIKIGYQKQPGIVEISDEAATLLRIKKMFDADKAMLAQLIKTIEKPIKDGLASLSGAQLKKLGVNVTEDIDKVVIKPIDGEVDKIVGVLLKGASDET